MNTYQTLAAAQETTAKAVLALVYASDFLVGNTILFIERIAKAVVPQQLFHAGLMKDNPFLKLCLDSSQQWLISI